jgi:hypothetical protein
MAQIRDMRQITLDSGETLAVEHVNGFVTSVWPGRENTSWIEVRQRDGVDRLCHALVALPLVEHQIDEVSFALGGKDNDTVLAWALWRSGTVGALPGLSCVASAAGARSLDPGPVGTMKFKLFAKLPAKVSAIESELADKLRRLLAAVKQQPALA